MSSNKRLLILSLSGIGNFIMQSPVFAAIKDAHPNWEITCWVAPRGTKELAQHNPHLDKVIEAPIQNSIPGHLSTIKTLQSKQFDIALVLSPGQQFKSAAILFAARIPQRLGHSYPTINSTHSRLFLTKTIAEQAAIHDLEQNLNLLSLLDIAPLAESDKPPYTISIPAVAEQAAAWIISGLDIPGSAPFVGLHPGGAPGFDWKHWPVDNFVAVAKHLISQYQAQVLIFGGPEELTLKQDLQQKIGAKHSTIISTNLLTAAALMQRCLVVVSNDSGLMHLSAASGATTLGLFGPTDEHLTGPRGSDSHTIRAHDTKPVYDTDQNFHLGANSHPSLHQLTSSLVLDKVTEITSY